MAVQSYKGNGYQSGTAFQNVPAYLAEAGVRNVYSLISFINGDSIASLAYLARVPSNARILPESALIASANAGLTSVSLGVYQPNGGAVISANVLMNAVNIAAGGKFLVAIAAGNLGKRVWELAGLAADPGGFLDLVLVINAASTAASTVEASIYYAK